MAKAIRGVHYNCNIIVAVLYNVCIERNNITLEIVLVIFRQEGRRDICRVADYV